MRNKCWNWLVIKFDRTISAGIARQAAFVMCVIVIFVGVFMLVEAIAGWDINIRECDREPWGMSILYHFMDPGNQVHAGHSAGSMVFLIFVSLCGSIVMSGILISTISNIIGRRVDRVERGQVEYDFRDHVVLIGCNRMIIGLLQQLYQREKAAECGRRIPYWLVIQTCRDVQRVRQELEPFIDEAQSRRVILLHGGRNSAEDLRKLKLSQCKEIFILGEENEYDHDSLNIECVKQIQMLLDQPSELKCHVLFENQSTFAVFQREDIFPEKEARKFDFLPFNFCETWAEKVLVRNSYEPWCNGEEKIEYIKVDRGGIGADSDKHVHFVVLGMSQMGIAMGLEAAHICHFPNFVTRGIKTRITFIDAHADVEFDLLRGRYRTLFRWCDYAYENTDNAAENYENPDTAKKFTDIEFRIIKGRVESDAIQHKLKMWAADPGSLLTIAVCLEIPSHNIATSLYMPDEVYDNPDVAVFVRQQASYAVTELLGRTQRFHCLQPFGMVDACYDIEEKTFKQATSVNYIYDHLTPGEALQPFDNVQAAKDWKGLSTAHRWSNLYNVNTLAIKKRSFDPHGIGESLADDSNTLELMAEVEHNRWDVEKLIMGYRPTTPEEDEQIAQLGKAKKKEIERLCLAHTCLKPFPALSDGAKDYDRLIMRYLWRLTDAN